MPRRPIQSLRSFCLVALTGAGLAACFIEPDEPPGWRAACAGDAECPGDGESCIDGLCQYPCTTATFADDCPSGGNYTTCFNGVCATMCDPENPGCSEPQSCQTLEIPPEFAELGVQDFSVCGLLCSDARPCPGAEQCFDGVCIDPNGLGGTETGTETGDESGTESETSGG